MTPRVLLAGLLWWSAVSVQALPRWYAPAVLRPGAVSEFYGFDNAPVPAFWVEVTRDGADRAFKRARGFAVDRPLAEFGPPRAAWKWSAALVALDALEAPGPVLVRFLAADRSVLFQSSAVVARRDFPVETIALDAAMSELRQQPNARKDREAAVIWSVYDRFDPGFVWSGGHFALPVAPVFPLSAHFGDTRDYLYSDGTNARDYHRGTDFAVPVGTLVKAAAAGRVVLAADRLLTGTTVVLEHGPGVYSVYFHLSRAVVKVGRQVAQGDVIAASGATGLVTGPHLHWEIRVGGVPVDPLELVGAGLLDTGAVSKIISSFERPIH